MRFSQVALTALPLLVLACQSTGDDRVTSEDGGNTLSGLADGDGGTLLLQAFGGASGQVTAQVPLLEPGVGPEQNCASPVVSGACQLTSCTFGGIGSPGPGYGNFGPISATVGTTTVQLTYDGTGYPTVGFPASVTLGTGGTMTFRGGGAGGVPSFDVSLTIPGMALLTSPALAPDGGGLVVDTSQDLSLAWAPIALGQVNFALTQAFPTSAGGSTAAIACSFGGAAGSGVVPQALLASWKKAVGSNTTFGNVSSELSTTTTIDGLTIETQSFQPSPTDMGSFTVVLQ